MRIWSVSSYAGVGHTGKESAQHFWLGKTLPILSCAPNGVRILGLWISTPIRSSNNWATLGAHGFVLFVKKIINSVRILTSCVFCLELHRWQLRFCVFPSPLFDWHLHVLVSARGRWAWPAVIVRGGGEWGGACVGSLDWQDWTDWTGLTGGQKTQSSIVKEENVFGSRRVLILWRVFYVCACVRTRIYMCISMCSFSCECSSTRWLFDPYEFFFFQESVFFSLQNL